MKRHLTRTLTLAFGGSNMPRHLTRTLALAIVASVIFATQAGASTIWSANFYRDNNVNTNNPLEAGDTVGLLPVDGWTNIGTSDTTAESVVSNDGTDPLTVTVSSISAGDGWHTPMDQTGEKEMLDTYLKADSFTVSISGLAAGEYDLYFYTFIEENGGGIGANSSVTLGSTTYWGEAWAPTDFAGYERSLNTTAGTAESGDNYVLFEGVAVTGPTDVISVDFSEETAGASGFASLSGLPVALIPEPASLALVGLGSLLMLGGRKRRRA